MLDAVLEREIKQHVDALLHALNVACMDIASSRKTKLNDKIPYEQLRALEDELTDFKHLLDK